VTHLEVVLPVKVVSEANQSKYEHWGTKARRVRSQRGIVKIGLYNFQQSLRAHKGAFKVTLMRIAPSPQGQTLDGDNLQRSMKAVRDQVAEACGVDDRAERIRFEYGQRKGESKQYAVEIGIALEEVGSP